MLNVGHAILEIKGDASPRAPSFVVENENFLLRRFKLRRVGLFFFVFRLIAAKGGGKEGKYSYLEVGLDGLVCWR